MTGVTTAPTGSQRAYLRPDVQIEPLWNRWHAWIHLLPPVTAARNLRARHIPLLTSYATSPRLHASALENPALRGGPFVDLGGRRADEVGALLAETRTRCAPLLAFADAVAELDRLLAECARGQALGPLYARLGEPLRGYVELCYDLRQHASARYFEPLLYRSELFAEDAQSLALSPFDERVARPFVLSTPRLPEPDTVELRRPFRDPAVDLLAGLRENGAAYGEVLERLTLPDEPRTRALFTTQAPAGVPGRRYAGDGVRIRYFGHACLLVETRDTALLIDPLVSYAPPPGAPARFTWLDLPERLDHVLLTHSHHDHVVPETLLQLRARTGNVVVGRNLDGLVQDPSLALALTHLGFGDVRELRDLDELPLPGGDSLCALPFLGEHHDLLMQSRCCYLLRLRGRRVLVMADSSAVEPDTYARVQRLVGDADLLFLGMECEGARPSWIYGPLYTPSLPRELDDSRRARGSNAEEALRLARQFACRAVYVYAMGQEPWLKHVLANELGPDSLSMRQIRELLSACAASGIEAEYLYASKEIELAPGRGNR